MNGVQTKFYDYIGVKQTQNSLFKRTHTVWMILCIIKVSPSDSALLVNANSSADSGCSDACVKDFNSFASTLLHFVILEKKQWNVGDNLKFILQEVTSKMLEIICIVSQDAQREIITCIPEVVDDAEHNVIAFDLKYVST